jgi:hypothetical protein
MAFDEWAQNNKIPFNNVWFSHEAHFHLDRAINKQNVWFWASENPCVIHEKVHFVLRITLWVVISSHGLLKANFLWQDSEQWALFKKVVQYFCASPSCYRFAITNSVVHIGWSQAAHSKCSELSAWRFWLACQLEPISWSFCMWTELAPEQY